MTEQESKKVIESLRESVDKELFEAFYYIKLHQLKGIKSDLYYFGKRDELYLIYAFIWSKKLQDVFSSTSELRELAEKKAQNDFEEEQKRKNEPIELDLSVVKTNESYMTIFGENVY